VKSQSFLLPLRIPSATGIQKPCHNHLCLTASTSGVFSRLPNVGPCGGLRGIGVLTCSTPEGRGGRRRKAKTVAEAYDAATVKYEKTWSKSFAFTLVTTSDDKARIATLFSRLLALPASMVACMTPATVKAGLVSAILSAGYHVDLGGGDHYNAKALRTKVPLIQHKAPFVSP